MSIGGSFAGGGQADQMMSMLKVLADPATLATRLEELKKAEESAAKVVALVGPADEILAIRARIEAEKEESARKLIEARETIERAIFDQDQILRTAQSSAGEIIEKAADQALEIKSQANELLSVAANREKSVKAEAALLEAEIAAVKNKQLELEALEASLIDRENQLATKKANFLEAQRSLTALIKD